MQFPMPFSPGWQTLSRSSRNALHRVLCTLVNVSQVAGNAAQIAH